MSKNIEPTPQDIGIAKNGIILQMQNSKILSYFASIDEAITYLGLWDFVNNQAMLIACERAQNRELYKYIHIKFSD